MEPIQLSTASGSPVNIYFNININISWPVVLNGIISYALFSKIAQVAARSISPLLEPMIPMIAALGSSTVTIASLFSSTREIIATVVINLVALAALTLYEIKRFPSATAKVSSLPDFVTDLTQEANSKPPRTYIGTELYIRELELCMLLPEKNNGILIGEPGIGKTLIVEDLAGRIARGDLPQNSPFRGKRILNIDLTAMIAGTMYRGQLEGKLKQVFDLNKADPNIVFFIDEIHQIVDFGRGMHSDLNLAGQLKAALARSGFRLLGATTRKEYNKFIAPDEALSRRFQDVNVTPPTPVQSFQRIVHQKHFYQRLYPNTTITDKAIIAAIVFAQAFMPHRRLPDPACDIIGKAFAYIVQHRETHQTAVTVDVHQIAEAWARTSKPPGVHNYSVEQLEQFFNKTFTEQNYAAQFQI